MFFRWWVYQHEGSEPSVEIELSEELSAAVDELARLGRLEREQILEDLVNPSWEFVEAGDGNV
jgi:predicted transcriptional regulator